MYNVKTYQAFWYTALYNIISKDNMDILVI